MVKDKAELNEALAAFNILQSENYDGAAHDLAPAQERIRRALSGFQPERGLVRLAVECAPEVRSGRNKLDNSENYGKSGEKRAALAQAMRQDVLTLMDRRDAAARGRWAGRWSPCPCWRHSENGWGWGTCSPA